MFSTRLFVSLCILFLALFTNVNRSYAQVAHKEIKNFSSTHSPLPAKTILAWSTEAAVAINTLDFAHYQHNLTTASTYFLPSTWKKFQEERKNKETLAHVLKEQQVISAILTDAPRIQKQGLWKNTYYWFVKVPILVSYQSPTKVTHVKHQLLMRIISSPNNATGIRGLAIAEISGC